MIRSEQSSGSAAEVLIVEDSPTQAQRLQGILAQNGYQVHVAASGGAALALARARKPALIISDVVMPEMDGYELCRRVKSDPAFSDVPVILVTTLSDPGDVIRGLECGADNFILKPYDERYLISRVQFVLVNRVMRQAEQGGLAVDVFFNGRRHTITADRLQILNLLLSTYDAAIQRNKELSRAKEELVERGTVLAQRERDLDEARAFLEHLIAASPSIVFRLEAAEERFRVTYVSPNVGWTLGYSADEIVGAETFWTDLIHPDDRETIRRTVIKALYATTAQIEHEVRWRTKDGRYRWFLVSMRVDYDAQTRPTAILCHALDITDRKRAQEALARAEERTRQILNTAHDAFIGVDGSGIICDWNLAAEKIFGWSRADAIGRVLSGMIIPLRYRDAHEAGLRRLAVTGEGPILNTRTELSALRRSGEEFPVELLVWPIELGQNRTFNAFIRDITQEKRAAAAVQQAKEEAERANRAKSDFLSRMSHDLRTPLNAILGFAQLLEMDSLTPEQHESVRHILRGGSHLLDLINEVLDLARIEAGHLSLSPEPVKVDEAVAHVLGLVGPLAARRHITVEHRPADQGYVTADRQRLNQILMNLLSNAIKYNRPAGSVRVWCGAAADGHVRISVADTGAGIPADKLKRVFRPFERLGAEQTAIEGTGLGLTLVKALVDAMGGTVGVQSIVDEGTTFWIQLPAAAPIVGDASPLRVPKTAASDPGAAGTILYIEDNASNRRLMERVLGRRPGVRLLGADSGECGVEAACSVQPDLIFLDLHLPDMHGEEVLRRLWENRATRGIPVAVLSADATMSQQQRLLAAGATAYLTKPLNVGEVLRLLDEHLSPRQDDAGGEPDEPRP